MQGGAFGFGFAVADLGVGGLCRLSLVLFRSLVAGAARGRTVSATFAAWFVVAFVAFVVGRRRGAMRMTGSVAGCLALPGAFFCVHDPDCMDPVCPRQDCRRLAVVRFVRRLCNVFQLGRVVLG